QADNHETRSVTDTRDRFLQAATKAFAERGFYGTSIAGIVDTLPFTKQALLHHFGSKEKLYGEVLKRISTRLMEDIQEVEAHFDEPRKRLEETFVHFYNVSLNRSSETQLLMRELLDNKRRAETARTWYLKPFLEALTQMVLDDTKNSVKSKQEAFSVVYQLLGSINYFLVSKPTLTRILGAKEYSKIHRDYEKELRKLIAARLD
ncbi:MAG: TetR/AcrR family transcriptional regulator, partial [Pseudomonadota bacterium]